MDVARLLTEEDRAWQRFHAVMERIPIGRMEEPTLTDEGWSPKDALFHVGAWLADCRGVLERIREGTFDRAEEPDTREAIDARNHEWFELSRSMDARDVRAELEAARTECRLAFGELGEAMNADAWEWFEESGPLHYADHGRDLEAWLG